MDNTINNHPTFQQNIASPRLQQADTSAEVMPANPSLPAHKAFKAFITRQFPKLASIRRKMKAAAAYRSMQADGNVYASLQSAERLPHLLAGGSEALYNDKTGFPMEYQRNKAHNLKLVARVLDGIVIRPGETFSFWMLARYADRTQPYRDGLVSVNGRVIVAPGGGLCQMSNSLFWAFLHSPLTIVERHGHTVKEFPEPNSDTIKGVDATIAEGIKDLKVRNDTPYSYQIDINFTDSDIVLSLYTDDPCAGSPSVRNGDIAYSREAGVLWEYAPVIRRSGGREHLLYINRCRIEYRLPEGTEILEGIPCMQN